MEYTGRDSIFPSIRFCALSNEGGSGYPLIKKPRPIDIGNKFLLLFTMNVGGCSNYECFMCKKVEATASREIKVP